jgi:predicted O-methyltransferase YrrM
MPLLKKTSAEEDLSRLESFAKGLRGVPDDRPAWLKSEVDEDDRVAHYYRFLYEFARAERPAAMLETGTRHGHSAAHLAMGNPVGRVVTLDIDPKSKEECDALRQPNVTAITSDSVLAAQQVQELLPELDLLFIDSAHVYEVASSEWRVYRPRLKHGCLAILDDIHICPEMERFWASIEDPKIELNFLHYMGFGIALKDSLRTYRG